MSVTMNAPEQIDARSWRLSWTGSGTFYIYRDGTLFVTTTQAELLVMIEPGDRHVFEVLDSATARAATAFPPRLTLDWWAVDDADHYLVEELVAGTWTQRAHVGDEGRGTCHWRTRVLEDGVRHRFRVVAVGADGNRGTAAAVTVLMVRHPDPDAVAFTYAAAGHTLALGAA